MSLPSPQFMVNLILLNEPDDWSNVFTRAQLQDWSVNFPRFLEYLSWYLKNGVRYGEVLSTYTCFRELRLFMGRPKGNKNAGINNNVGNGNSGTRGNAEWKWINITLSDEDISVLASSDATLEYLATSAVTLADDGIGFKIEPTDAGKSIRCTIYRSNMGDGNVIVGVSSYSGTIRDALLAGLYKLDTYLGGDFSTLPDETLSQGSKPRFR